MEHSISMRALSVLVLVLIVPTATIAQSPTGAEQLPAWSQGGMAQTVRAYAAYPMAGEPAVTSVLPLVLYDYYGHSSWIAIQNCGTYAADIDLDLYLDGSPVAHREFMAVPAFSAVYFDLGVEGVGLGLSPG